MAKLNFTKALNEVKKKGICVNQLTTDRHTGIRKYMRESKNRKQHVNSMFGIKKRLHKIGKNKSCENLQKWTKSRSNHF